MTVTVTVEAFTLSISIFTFVRSYSFHKQLSCESYAFCWEASFLRFCQNYTVYHILIPNSSHKSSYLSGCFHSSQREMQNGDPQVLSQQKTSLKIMYFQRKLGKSTIK